MKLEKYYDLLAPKEGDRILVEGVSAILTGLYIAGKARASGLKVLVHAMIPPSSSLLSETDAMKFARRELPKYAEAIEEGIPFTTFSVETIETMRTRSAYNKAVLQWKDFDELLKKLPKLDMMTVGEKLVLLEAPFGFFRKLSIVRKKMFGENIEVMSLRGFLRSVGFQVKFYEAIDSSLLCLFNAGKMEAPARITPVDSNLSGAAIIKELIKYIVYMRTDVQVCIESDDKEYLYLIQIDKTKNQPITCKFIFLDGEGEWKDKVPVDRSRSFVIIVLPDTPAFRSEIEAKEILICPKERAFELYGEDVEPE